LPAEQEAASSILARRTNQHRTSRLRIFSAAIAEGCEAELTERAMLATAAASGLYFAPAAKYFMAGKVGRDQIEDYARRPGMTAAEAAAGCARA
jgi:5-methyltetrahydrofolate--homocysteine methyltransferase